MSAYQHVLAVVDLGATSAKVLQHAARVARLCGAGLSVLHVVNYSLSADADYVIPPDDEKERMLVESALQKLHELVAHEELDGIAQCIVTSGRPKVEILRTAEREEADLIVVGAHGRHGLTGLLGSTADRVLHRATCDVLTVQ